VTGLKLLTLAVAVIAYAAFASSVVLVFRRATEGAGSGLTILKLGALSSALLGSAAIVRAPTTPSLAAIGLGGLVASLSLFAWSIRTLRRNHRLTLAFSTDSPERMLTVGPYAMMRHPFYTSYLLTYLSVFVAAPSILSLLPVCFMSVVYGFAARYEERKFALSSHAVAYDQYRATTGMFFPRLHTLTRVIRA
jgi:protein-S-isoprenylcysteine O-methyltransferase Ste14